MAEKQVGYIKEFDALGRIVVPKEYRELLFPDGRVEVILTKDGVLIRSPKYKLVERKCSKSKDKR